MNLVYANTLKKKVRPFIQILSLIPMHLFTYLSMELLPSLPHWISTSLRDFDKECCQKEMLEI